MADDNLPFEIPSIDEAELLAWLDRGSATPDSHMEERDTHDAKMELEAFFGMAQSTSPPAPSNQTFIHQVYEQKPLQPKASRGIYGEASRLYRERKKQKIAAMEDQLNNSQSEMETLRARVLELEDTLRMVTVERDSLRAQVASGSNRPAVAGGVKAEEEQFTIMNNMQRQIFRQLNEMVANPETTEEEYAGIVKQCEQFGSRRNFIPVEDYDEIATPRFLLRNAQLNPMQADCEEEPEGDYRDELDKWKAIAPLSQGIYSEAQGKQFFVVRTQYRRKLREIMGERRELMAQLHVFFMKKIAYTRKLNVIGAESSAINVAQAANNIAKLRMNLRKVNALRHWLLHAMHNLYTNRQLAYLYSRSRQWSVSTVNALDATVALVTSVEMPVENAVPMEISRPPEIAPRQS